MAICKYALHPRQIHASIPALSFLHASICSDYAEGLCMCRCVVCVYLCSQCFIVSAFTFSDLMLLVGRQERQHYLHLTQGTDNTDTHTHTAHLRSYDTQPMCGVTTHTLRSHDTVFILHKALTTHTHTARLRSHDTHGPCAESRHTHCVVTTLSSSHTRH